MGRRGRRDAWSRGRSDEPAPFAESPGFNAAATVNSNQYGVRTPLNTPNLGGYIKIEMQNAAGAWVDVTQEILGLGIGSPQLGVGAAAAIRRRTRSSAWSVRAARWRPCATAAQRGQRLQLEPARALRPA